ncbi:aminotransferase class V-fold PLP-dependent enzyme [Aureliella helgolandensis]|uniref:Cysteine desulfurase n=1 Tax=Aureliella helgolandensis TaxID=2527968 RepID=A0A518GDC1_9BACT|nr:aminotransferase class V-fold PLP-dependent enzyme [Aureliella helgolandensis]QDV26558.1 Cysteine desulfurase [Aureliella helgolandensis]
MAQDVRQQLRSHMPVTAKYAYFDHAAVGPLPTEAAQAIQDYAQTASQHGDVHWLDWSAGVQNLRQQAASLLNASPDEITLVNNTTGGLNLIAEALPWQPGDNVVVPANEFPSNYLPWKNLERLGVELRAIPVPPSGEISLKSVSDTMDSRTRLLAISWVGFSSGYRLDVGSMVELAHARDCLVMLDAIQGLGAFPIDVQETQIDFVCADGHKWMLGPEGAGLLYIRAAHLERLRPMGLGWGSLAAGAFEPGSAKLKTTAARYEGGSANMPGLLGFGGSLGLLCRLGCHLRESPIAQAILENVQQLEGKLLSAGFELSLPTRSDQRSGIVGITWGASAPVPESTLIAARQMGLEQGVVTSVRGGRLRASTHAYNDIQDIDRLVDVLKAARKKLSS